MALKWIICGAGSGVGKTWLAQALLEVLPDAVYAKLGHCPKKKGKPGNYFRTREELLAFAVREHSRQHILVESNALASQDWGDFTIYLEGIAGQTDFREDAAALRKKADIAIRSGADERRWTRSLLRHGIGEPLAAAIREVLRRQLSYLTRNNRLEIRTKFWFVAGDGRAMGLGLAALLEQIEQSGSLSAAALQARMSYRHAWGLIRSAEKHLGLALVQTRVGGPDGGRTDLSAEGRRLLAIFGKIGREITDFADARFGACLREQLIEETGTRP